MLSPISLDWNQIHHVFLDMDGTLLDLHFDNHFWLEHVPLRFSEKHHLPLDKAKNEVMRVTQEKEGTLDWYCLRYWSQRLDLDIIALKHEVSHKISIRNNVEKFLLFLQQQQADISLLTNADRDCVEVKFNYAKIESYFNQIISSHDLGIAKEQAGFWDKLALGKEFDPEHTLFIDDNLQVLREAQAHGVKYLLAIDYPDSQQRKKDTGEFIGIACFSQLIAN
jgi:putative hydrolase of the HAD superfamily